MGILSRGIIAFFVIVSTLKVKAAEPEAVPGEFIIQFKKNTISATSLRQLEKSLDIKVKRIIPNTNLALVQSQKISTLSAKAISQKLMKNKNIILAEPNYIYRINKVSNDPELGKLWGIINTGQVDSRGSEGIVGVDVGAERAWDLQTGDKDLLVAVIDTGVDYTHNDLKENAWVNEAERAGQPGVDDDENGFIDDIYGYDFANHDADPMDDHGHGSHCSGTIGGKGDDGRGIVGVAWNVKIMGVKFLGGDGSGTLDGAVESINYATKMGAKIMSNSWGGGGYSEILKNAIQEASDKGIIFTAAAGNDSKNNDGNPSYPASYNVPNVISVAAINNRGELADFSNYGNRTVHVAAPGVNVYSSVPGGYEVMSGTSMATPHVSGVVALLLSQEPNLTPVEVKERLIKTSKPAGPLRGKVISKGIVNAYTALINELAPPDPNDPENWTDFKPVEISTPHPYQDKYTQSWEYEIPGVSQFALLFENFKTEARYDTVTLTNRAGEKIGVLSGDIGTMWSPNIIGDYVKITFTSDSSVTGYGFDIKKAAYKP